MYVAYYLHWSMREVLNLEHPARVRVIEEIGRIHGQVNTTEPAGG